MMLAWDDDAWTGSWDNDKNIGPSKSVFDVEWIHVKCSLKSYSYESHPLFGFVFSHLFILFWQLSHQHHHPPGTMTSGTRMDGVMVVVVWYVYVYLFVC